MSFSAGLRAQPLLETLGGPLDDVVQPEAAQRESIKIGLWQHWWVLLPATSAAAAPNTFTNQC